MSHTIVLYMPNRGQIETETVESLLRVLAHPLTREIPIGAHFLTGDSLIPRARNECAAHFLDSTSAQAMLFIDSDIVFSPDDVFSLWATGLDLVGANYHVSRRTVQSNEERAVVPMRPDAPAVAPVSRLATGFLMIRRVVFERLAKTAETYVKGGAKRFDFFSSFIREGDYLSEDFAFCARAVRAGITPHLLGTIRLGHIGRREWRLPEGQSPSKE